MKLCINIFVKFVTTSYLYYPKLLYPLIYIYIYPINTYLSLPYPSHPIVSSALHNPPLSLTFLTPTSKTQPFLT